MDKDGPEQQDLRGGPITKSDLGLKLERARKALEAAMEAAHGWHRVGPSGLAVEAIHATASALKKVRKLEADLTKDK